MRTTIGLALTCAYVFAAACSKGGGSNADTVAKADTGAAAPAAATPTPAAVNPTLSDANIVAILDAANVADSAAGKIASTKATNKEVKDFAQMMMRDHHALRKQGEDLAKKLNLTPAMPAGDTSQTAAQHWQDSLNAMPKGAGFDKAYIDHEVAYHQQVLQTATAAQGAAQDTSLKALITKAAPNIQAHLTKAESIQSKLSGAAKP